jgi:hypothetical protein
MLADSASPTAGYGTWAGVGVALVLGVWNRIDTVRRNKQGDERDRLRDEAAADQRKQMEAAFKAETETREKEGAEEAKRWQKEFDLLSEQLEAQRQQEERRRRHQALQIRTRYKELPRDHTGRWKVCICNYSHRPIRRVRAGIRSRNGSEKYSEASVLFGPAPLDVKIPDMADDCRLDWLNSETYCIFRFPVKKVDLHDPDIAIRFIDDEDNEWQMSEGSVLKPLVEADWPDMTSTSRPAASVAPSSQASGDAVAPVPEG